MEIIPANEQEKNKTTKIWLLAFPFLFMVLGTIRDCQILPVNKFLLVTIAAIGFYFFNYEQIIYFLCFLIPLKEGIPGNYIFLLALIALFLKVPQIHKEQIIFPVIIIGYEIILSIISPYSIHLIDTVSYCTRIFLVFFLLYTDMSNISIKKMCLWSSIGVVYLIFIISLVTFLHTGLTKMLTGNRLGPTTQFIPHTHDIMMFTVNPNGISYYTGIAFSCFIILLYQDYKETKLPWSINRTLYLIGLLVVLLGGLLSVSRTFVVVAVLATFIMFLHICNKQHWKLAVGIVIGTSILSIIFANTELGHTVLKRFVINKNLLTGSGRTDIFKNYLQYQLSHINILLFGTGALPYYQMRGNFLNSMHNMVQQLFFCYGLFGGAFFLYALFKPIGVMIKDKIKINVPYSLPFITIVLCAQTTQFLLPNDVLMLFPICILICEYNLSKKHPETDLLKKKN